MLLIIGNSCTNKDEVFEGVDIEEGINEEIDIPDWTTQTHSKDGEIDYGIVFSQDKVNRIDIVIDSDSWAAMESDLLTNLSSHRGPPGELDFDPVWVPCDVFFDDIQWYKVGIRYKGNSSLSSTFQQGIKKLPFKLDFDEFEDTYPAIDNQRFFGFKQLNLKNNFDDQSFIREKVASDLFYDFGLASPMTSFYSVYVDFGEGATYFGLYTMVEEVDNTVIKTQFINNDGNLYKPDGDAASFASGTFDTSEMFKKTNEDDNDYADVQQLYEAIHSSLRNGSYEEWKLQLKEILDVQQFLRWLAANTVMQNWDTYGRMTHNYYLYTNPETELLTWIPWDNNEALQYGKQGGALSLGLDEVNDNWPLIRYIIDDETWQADYNRYMIEFIENAFESNRMISIYSTYHDMLKDYVIGDQGEVSRYSFLKNDNDFEIAIETLKNHVKERGIAVKNYLAD